MRYVARKYAIFTLLPLLLSSGCSLRILGVDKSALMNDSGIEGNSGANNGINSFSVLGASGGTDTTADTYLTDGTTLTAEWVDTTGEDSYEVKVLDSSGSATLCGPATVAADSISHTFSSCALSHGTTYRIQVTAKNTVSGAAQSAQGSFQVGPFITLGNVTTNEAGVASVLVTLSYASPNTVTLQYVTADSTAQAGSDYIHSPLGTFTIPAGQTSAKIPIPILSDYSVESTEQFRVEIVSATGAGLLSTNAQVTVQDDDLSPASGFIQVATGASHTCAVTSAGGVQCWGRNLNGQLGDNSTTDRAQPVSVLGLSSGIAQVAAGNDHTCALTSLGAVLCWGLGIVGQLGDNTLATKLVPTAVLGLSSGVTQVAAGGTHACALLTSGGLKCWGNNSSLQLGDNTSTNRPAPVDVFGLASGVAQVATGSQHTCALMNTGAVKCWGQNIYGQLGDNTTTPRSVPVDVSGLSSGILQIAMGTFHSCALTISGAVKCWGYNSTASIGDNSTTNRLVPTDVFGLSSGFNQISSQSQHTCALTSSGAAKCWGKNTYAQLGDQSDITPLTPVVVPDLAPGVIQIAAGGEHTCALNSGGSIQCWGLPTWGQLGRPVTTNRGVPTDFSGFPSGASQVAAGFYHSCILTTSGEVKCIGLNADGQIGDSTLISRRNATSVTGLSSGVVQIVARESHSCALTSSGAVQCWGSNGNGELGDNTTVDKSAPTQVNGLASGITQITTGFGHGCALTSTGGVKCWGANSSGQLGDNSVTQRLVPVDVFGLSSGVIQIASGGNHTCALTSSGAIKCWGNDFYGQLGDNSTVQKSIPTDVLGLTSDVTQITAGTNHTCALTSAGAVKCWGYNGFGQIGDNSTTDSGSQKGVFGLSSGIAQVFSGANHTCAIDQGGSLKCWGRNSNSQLGDSTTQNKLIPQDVPSLASGVLRGVGGNLHTCAIITGGALKCWGYNFYGQVGDSYYQWNPQYVVAP